MPVPLLLRSVYNIKTHCTAATPLVRASSQLSQHSLAKLRAGHVQAQYLQQLLTFLAPCAGDERIDFLLHKRPLFHMHWKDGRVPLDVRNKIVVIPGDLHKPSLGLAQSDRERIIEEVDFVIHSAASISFFEHIHTLLEQNYEVRPARLASTRGFPLPCNLPS